MKLARYEHGGSAAPGVVDGDAVIPLSAFGPGYPGDLKAVLAGGRPLWSRMAQALASIPAGARVPLSEVRLLAPIPDPQKFLAINLNYKAHAEEAAAAGIPTPETQFWFNKQVSCITGPFDGIDMPKVSDKLDYEVELGVVIGTRCRHVPVETALDVVGGYVVMNDVSVRDWQFRSTTYTLGKSFDTHGPMGPWITTADEIPDPHKLHLKLWVNGELRQDYPTADMIYTVQEQIAYLSTVMTLEPGDMLSTGTPSGVGIALGKLLKVGDVVRAEVSKLGQIENRVVPES